jgi:PadR family transcriptional regulator, regulatory protein PadR
MPMSSVAAAEAEYLTRISNQTTLPCRHDPRNSIAGPCPRTSLQSIRDMLTPNRNMWQIPVVYQQEKETTSVATTPSDVPYGTLDLMVLKTLDALSPLHGYGIARRIEQVAQGSLALNQGTIYPALLRLEQKGWIKSEWGTSENNRRARFYSITRAGRKQLATEAESWARTVAMVDRLLGERS